MFIGGREPRRQFSFRNVYLNLLPFVETQRKHQTTQQEVSCLRLSTQEQPLALFILA